MLFSCIRWSPLLVVFVCSGCLSPIMREFEQSSVFQPAVYPEGDWLPAVADYEDAFFESDDGTHLHGWYLDHPNPQAVVLFAHGNAGNLSTRLPLIRELRDRHQVAVMIFDYRGYGRSEGAPDEAGILQDARAARRWLAERTETRDEDVVLVGRSLGGGVAVDLAANDGARGLVLISTFTSLPDVARHHLPLLPAHLLMSNRLDSLSKIGTYRGPLLQCHGDRDEVVPYDLALRLHSAANRPKQFVSVRNGRHNDDLAPEFHEAFTRFLETLPTVQSLQVATAD